MSECIVCVCVRTGVCTFVCLDTRVRTCIQKLDVISAPAQSERATTSFK